jgi:hypothetical protein
MPSCDFAKATQVSFTTPRIATCRRNNTCVHPNLSATISARIVFRGRAAVGCGRRRLDNGCPLLARRLRSRRAGWSGRLGARTPIRPSESLCESGGRERAFERHRMVRWRQALSAEVRISVRCGCTPDASRGGRCPYLRSVLCREGRSSRVQDQAGTPAVPPVRPIVARTRYIRDGRQYSAASTRAPAPKRGAAAPAGAGTEAPARMPRLLCGQHDFGDQALWALRALPALRMRPGRTLRSSSSEFIGMAISAGEARWRSAR